MSEIQPRARAAGAAGVVAKSRTAEELVVALRAVYEEAPGIDGTPQSSEDLTEAERTDRLEDTVDYRQLRFAAQEVIEGEPKKLLESLAGAIAERILEIPRVKTVLVRIAKRPASMQPIEAAAVRIYRTRA